MTPEKRLSYIQRAIEIHNGKYDYSLAFPQNTKEKATIICPEHGEFQQNFNSHIYQKAGCPICSGKYAYDTDELINRLKSVFGDKYDYSKTVYNGANEKVIVTCLEHGDFSAYPRHLLNGHGCPECGSAKSKNTRNKGNEKFIEEAQKVHNGKYDYSKVNYENNRTKVCIICPEHGEFWQRPCMHIKGQGCPVCGEISRRQKRTTSAEDFILQAQNVHENKYDYSKVSYINNGTKVCIICPEHGEFWQTPNNHLQGKGCPICGNKIISQKLSLGQTTFINKAQSVHGNKYDYSKVDYVNNRTLISIICPEHGEFSQTPQTHLQGCGCPQCGQKSVIEKISSNKQIFVKKANAVHHKKYDYSKVVYKNCDEKVQITCPEHGEFWQSPYMHLKGQGCPICAQIANGLCPIQTLETFVAHAKAVHGNKYDYSKVVYKNAKTKVCIICPEHGEFWQTPTLHVRGCGCSKCQHQQSKAELEIVDYLKTIVPSEEVLERNRELLDGQEIDIFLPKYHLGIEYNGLHWHSLKMKPDLNYHKNKMALANSKGYRLIQIFEDEWLEHKGIVLNKLKHIVGGDANSFTVGARKCNIIEIDRQIAEDFLITYHIQGFVPSTTYLGAYYDDELVGVMTFKEESPKMWNLTRFTTKTVYKLPGLANKMFKYFTKNYEFDEIKSFLDLRWNQSLNGNTVYDKLGFVLEKYTRPDYRYIVGSQRLHKFGFRKQILHKKYGLPLTMTEMEMCDQLGFDRIYDCGLAKYVWRNEKK